LEWPGELFRSCVPGPLEDSLQRRGYKVANAVDDGHSNQQIPNWLSQTRDAVADLEGECVRNEMLDHKC